MFKDIGAIEVLQLLLLLLTDVIRKASVVFQLKPCNIIIIITAVTLLCSGVSQPPPVLGLKKCFTTRCADSPYNVNYS